MSFDFVNFAYTNFFPSITLTIVIIGYAVRDRVWKINVDKKLHVMGIITRALLIANKNITADQMKNMIFEAETQFNPKHKDPHYLVDRLAQDFDVDLSELRRKRKK